MNAFSAANTVYANAYATLPSYMGIQIDESGDLQNVSCFRKKPIDDTLYSEIRFKISYLSFSRNNWGQFKSTTGKRIWAMDSNNLPSMKMVLAFIPVQVSQVPRKAFVCALFLLKA